MWSRDAALVGCAAAGERNGLGGERELPKSGVRSGVASAPLVHAMSALAATEGRTPELYVQCADAKSCPSAVGMLVVEGDEAQEARRRGSVPIGF